MCSSISHNLQVIRPIQESKLSLFLKLCQRAVSCLWLTCPVTLCMPASDRPYVHFGSWNVQIPVFNLLTCSYSYRVQQIPLVRPTDIRPSRMQGQFSLDKTVGLTSRIYCREGHLGRAFGVALCGEEQSITPAYFGWECGVQSSQSGVQSNTPAYFGLECRMHYKNFGVPAFGYYNAIRYRLILYTQFIQSYTASHTISVTGLTGS